MLLLDTRYEIQLYTISIHRKYHDSLTRLLHHALTDSDISCSRGYNDWGVSHSLYVHGA